MERQAWLVAGLAFGDEGKGATVDYLVRKHKATLVVRYNGGAQAGHNVVTPDGRHHTFSQWGSGTFAGAHTYLSKHVIIDPLAMMNEAKHLQEIGIADPWRFLNVDGDALVITPFQRAASRIIERARAQNGNAHGSCGMGIGHTRADHLKFGNDVVFTKDLKGDPKLLRKKMQFMRRESIHSIPAIYEVMDNSEDWSVLGSDSVLEWCIQQYAKWPAYIVQCKEGLLQAHNNIVFEGAQGMLLDEKFGTAPHNTWTDITFTNANELLALSNFHGDVLKVGVVRSYYTRHGAGPFPTEDKRQNPEPHNDASGFQGVFRQGAFDWSDFNYALMAIGGVDVLAVNHLDVMPELLRVPFVRRLSYNAHTSAIVCGTGPTYKDRELISAFHLPYSEQGSLKDARWMETQ